MAVDQELLPQVDVLRPRPAGGPSAAPTAAGDAGRPMGTAKSQSGSLPSVSGPLARNVTLTLPVPRG